MYFNASKGCLLTKSKFAIFKYCRVNNKKTNMLNVCIQFYKTINTVSIV